MAPEKNNSNFLSISPNFFNQLLFGLFLTLVLLALGYPLSQSLFFGVLGGLSIGWMATASQGSPKAGSVASTEGIDAGLKYWLFFLLGFVLLGYQAPVSILLGSLAGIGGGWTIAWWKSKEEYRTQLPEEFTENAEAEQPALTTNTRRRTRKPARRYRRSFGSFNFPKFWQR
ncbi:hypothetical protein ACF3DV_22285 [Chlorogloeopsis fritschii PCC 9212]|jgi:hypothetical protein|uniref:Uncharacterized protein n=1 Tax=Chlorogloeopsis fritschii PCC 6912 TaxID=211165 RepID=A0A3S0ZHE3_CHLFR|nr:hypothetical protein [Chlorogloeopsis fritschii]MBF2003896.1 hypothetical protein [Chlorogloeopsis fritschii C42_A2020_084]RUR76247.1 hypothetical protein PCC6912_44190 [Chlorogloeopsis fritschii PCC 6912]